MHCMVNFLQCHLTTIFIGITFNQEYDQFKKIGWLMHSHVMLQQVYNVVHREKKASSAVQKISDYRAKEKARMDVRKIY